MKPPITFFIVCLFFVLVGCRAENDDFAAEQGMYKATISTEIGNQQSTLTDLATITWASCCDVEILKEDSSYCTTDINGKIDALTRHMGGEPTCYLPLIHVDNYSEFMQIKTKYGEVLDLHNGNGNIPAFTDATEHINENYFEQYTLLLIYIPAENTEDHYGVSCIYIEGDMLIVHVQRETYFGAQEKAGRIAVVPVERELVSKNTLFGALLDR